MPATKMIAARDQGRAEPARGVDGPSGGETAEHRERRQHQHEMPDAVIHRRPQRDRRCKRQQRGQHDQQKDGSTIDGNVEPERSDQRAGGAAEAEQEKNFRQLEREQRRHVAARHVGNGDQSTAEQLLPRLLEEVRKILDRPERVERIDHRPRPNQRHHGIGQQHGGRERQEEASDPRAGWPDAARPGLAGKDRGERNERLDRTESAHDARAERQAEADADQRHGGRRWARVVVEGANQAEQENRHRDRERRVLRIHEHVAVVERAGGEEDEGDETCERPADAPARPPGDEQPENPDDRADEPPRLEHRERQCLGGECGEEVEAAAVVVEVHPRQRAPVGESRGVEREQELAVFGMNVIVPAQPIVAEGQQRDDADETERRDREPVEDAV